MTELTKSMVRESFAHVLRADPLFDCVHFVSEIDA